MSRRCEACGEAAFEADARYCIACGGRMIDVMVNVADPEPEALPAAGSEPLPTRADVPPPDIPFAPAPPRPVRERGDEVPVALVLAGVAALLLVLLGLLLLT